MKVRSHLSMNGEFDQERPLVQLRSQKKSNSLYVDSKLATDRWPLSIIYTFMFCVWGSTLESSIVNRHPLGYYGSWSLFALSHNYMVWLAAMYAYPTTTTPFADYALLGDDILITDTDVSRQYRILLDRLAKSIISENRTLEFAKRFWIKDIGLTSSRTTVGLCILATKY
uniref:Uncharacterized protein n=1 Tax=Solanum lycopersicum TaxID=4081 RepID=A0A3Q7IUS3_SOLLC